VVRLRDDRTIVLEATRPGPNGGVAARCQAIAARFDRDPSGALAGQCTHPSHRGSTVCASHGATAPQVVAAARRRLAEASGDVAERLVGLALDGKVKDGDTLRAIDSVLDRAGVPRATAIEVGQTRSGIGERLDALELGAAESPGEDVADDAGRPDALPPGGETVDAGASPSAAGHDAPVEPDPSVSDGGSGSAPDPD
ncbi:MAG: hypothetical protein ACRDQD_12405, partial [Nocardioidaceae bacterium]